MMSPEWHEAFRMHSETTGFKALVRRSHVMIASAIDDHTLPYVSFSGGKDSTVTLHLVLSHLPEIMVYHWWTGSRMMPDDLEAEVVANARAMGAVNLRVETSERYNDPNVSEHDKERLFKSEYLAQAVPRLRREGYDLGFVGIRAEESKKRAFRIADDGAGWFMDSCYPVGTWTYRDIWAYIVAHNLPYPSTYDLQIPIVGPKRARFGSFFVAKHAAYGTESLDGVALWRWKNAPKAR